MAVGAALLAALAGCDELVPAAELGARLLRDPWLSTSPFNRWSCATCHRVEPPGGLPAADVDGRHPGPILAGYGLADSVNRPSWWGGDQVILLDAVNFCLSTFMGGRPLAADEERARRIYEYLVSVSPEPALPALPVTVVRTILNLSDMAGDAARGQDLYDRGCRSCHGDAHTGNGRNDVRAVIIPESTVAVFGAQARAAVVEKVRHGRFFHVGGFMPFYSLEVISDAELVDILAFLGV
jgi:thiosulfate dehydrogenase